MVTSVRRWSSATASVTYGDGVVGDGVGDVGDGVVGDGVGDVGDGVVGDWRRRRWRRKLSWVMASVTVGDGVRGRWRR